MEAKVASERTLVKSFLKAKGDEKLDTVTLRQVYEGSRGIPTMAYEPSLLDAQTGITFRGLSIPECQKQLPAAPNGGKQPLPESILWLLLTGTVPTAQQVKDLSENLAARAAAAAKAGGPLAEAYKVLDSVPQPNKPTDSSTGYTHPMQQLILGSVALGRNSRFKEAYDKGTKKNEYWKPCLEDSLDLIAILPNLAAKIFRNTYQGAASKSENPASFQRSGADFTQTLVEGMQLDAAVKSAGATVDELVECLRLYLTIHVDHEGGNVSAHATQLVGSALSDPYLSFAAGMAGLAGPLHGLANQEVLTFLKGMMKELQAKNVDVAKIDYDKLKQASIDYAWSVLNSGKVIPGFGHAVLRQTDPRYVVQREFALAHMKDFPLFRVVSACFDTFPGVLTEHGKTKNPFPNVDAHSGCLLTVRDGMG